MVCDALRKNDELDTNSSFEDPMALTQSLTPPFSSIR